MQVRVANLFITNPKIPYTDKGIGLIQNQMIASLKSGVYYEGIAPDEYDEDGEPHPRLHHPRPPVRQPDRFAEGIPQADGLQFHGPAGRCHPLHGNQGHPDLQPVRR